MPQPPPYSEVANQGEASQTTTNQNVVHAAPVTNQNVAQNDNAQ